MKLNRREIARGMSMGAAGALLLQSARGQPPAQVKAIVFDTFGTVVDWRGSIIAEGEAWG